MQCLKFISNKPIIQQHSPQSKNQNAFGNLKYIYIYIYIYIYKLYMKRKLEGLYLTQLIIWIHHIKQCMILSLILHPTFSLGLDVFQYKLYHRQHNQLIMIKIM